MYDNFKTQIPLYGSSQLMESLLIQGVGIHFLCRKPLCAVSKTPETAEY